MHFHATFIVLSFSGLINAGYLAYKHYFEKKPLVCPIGHDCNAVVESRWGNIFGVRNEILGVLYYASVLAAGIINVVTPMFFPQLTLLLLVATGVGFVFSIFLTLVQKYAIKDYCFYCLISAGLSALLFLNTIVLYW